MASTLQWFPAPLWVLLKDPQQSVHLDAQPTGTSEYIIYAFDNYPGSFPLNGGPITIKFHVHSVGTTPIIEADFNTLKDAYDACQANWGSPLTWFLEPLWVFIKDPQSSFILWCMPSPNIQYVVNPYLTNYPGSTFPVQGGPPNVTFHAYSIGANPAIDVYFDNLKAAYDACQANWNSQPP